MVLFRNVTNDLPGPRAGSYASFTFPPYGASHGPPTPPPPRRPQPTIRGLDQPRRGRHPRILDGHRCRPRPGLGLELLGGDCPLDGAIEPLGPSRPERPQLEPVDHHAAGRHTVDAHPAQLQPRPPGAVEGELVVGSVWWYVARSSGIVAWGLAALSVLWGLLLSTKVMGRRVRSNWLLDLHRFLGGLTVVFVAIHLLGLVLDPYVDFGAAQLLIPFASTWKPVAVAWGVVGFYLLLAVEVTSLLRSHIPKRWWKAVHMSSYAIYVLGTVHLLTAGTDRRSTPLLWTVVATTVVIAAMTLVRIFMPRETRTIDADTIRSAQPIG